jgi:hypothetical protein
VLLNRALLALSLGAILTLPNPSLAAKVLSPNEQEVIAPLQSLLHGLATRDQAMMAAQLVPGGQATLMRNGRPVQLGFEAFVERLSAPGTDAHLEVIHDPLIRIDDNVAIIWTRYEFLLNGKVDHCGTDIVQLAKVEGRWLIASLGDNSRSDCSR